MQRQKGIIHESLSAGTGIKIEAALFSDLVRFIENKIGLSFAEERRRDLERGMISVAREFGFEDAETCIHWLLSASLSHNEIELLAGHLTVGETYFFRNQASFDALAEHVLPELVRSRRGGEQRIRIWSAGCSSGEEAYSIAMLLDKRFPDLKDWSITILATDINPHALKKASKGVFSEWSFRDTPAWVKSGYFIKSGNSYEIASHIRKMVTFSYHNLAEDPYPALSNNTSAMDIIFCRNVLMYFSRDRAREVMSNLHRCLVDGGWLLISPVEAAYAISAKFRGMRFPDTTIYRKAHPSKPEPNDKAVRRAGVIPDTAQIEEPGPNNFRRPAPEAPAKTSAPLRKRIPPSGEAPADVAEKESKADRFRSLACEAANLGRLSEALGFCEEAIASEKLNASLYYLKATILQEMNNIQEAAASLGKAIYIDHRFVIAHFALGCLMHREGRHKQAGKHLENARSLAALYGHDEILPESEGMSAGRLVQIIDGIKNI